MIKIIDVVEELALSDDEALPLLRRGELNLAAYARRIRPEVARRAKKPVEVGTIVVSLTRLTHKFKKAPALVPKVHVDDISVRSNLVELTFNRTPDNVARLKSLYRTGERAATDVLLVSQGAGEITVVTTARSQSRTKQCFAPSRPKVVLENLAGLTLRFSDNYIPVPNIIYAFVRTLARERIIIVEIVSTYTELTFVLNEKDLQRAFALINDSFR